MVCVKSEMGAQRNMIYSAITIFPGANDEMSGCTDSLDEVARVDGIVGDADFTTGVVESENRLGSDRPMMVVA